MMILWWAIDWSAPSIDCAAPMMNRSASQQSVIGTARSIDSSNEVLSVGCAAGTAGSGPPKTWGGGAYIPRIFCKYYKFTLFSGAEKLNTIMPLASFYAVCLLNSDRHDIRVSCSFVQEIAPLIIVRHSINSYHYNYGKFFYVTDSS